MTPPTNNAATTAMPAPSVAVTMPAKMQPRMTMGRMKAQSASLNVCHTWSRRKRSSIGKVVAHRLPVGGAGKSGAPISAGHDAGDEQFHHRGLCHDRVKDHRDRRRDDDGEARRGGDDRGRDFLGIAASLHRRDQDSAERCHVGHRRAGNLGEEQRRADRHHRQPAAHEADQRRGKSNQPSRDRGGVHDGAGEDEQRDRQQREARGAVEHHQREIGQHGRALDDDDRDERHAARAPRRSAR